MVNNLGEWLPYLLVALLSGLTNYLSAWLELEKKCRCLPFFNRLKSFGFWIWTIVQILAPSLLAWFILNLPQKPPIDLTLIFSAFCLGIGFTALCHATSEVGTIPIDIEKFYNLFVTFAYDSIESQYAAKSAQFWVTIKQELNQSYINFESGFDYLKEYFSNQISLEESQTSEKQDKIQTLRQLTNQDEKIGAILKILKTQIRRKDLPTVLKNFNCTDEFIKNNLNFSRKPP